MKTSDKSQDTLRDSLESIKKSTREAVALQMRILNELGEGVLIEDKTGKIIFTNPSASALLNELDYRIIGKNFVNFIQPEEERARVENILKRIKISNLGSIKFETLIIREDNPDPIYILVYYSQMKSNGELEGALITLYDISDIKSLSQKIQDRSNELMQAEKMASIGLLASGVAHELNNPLAFIISNTYTLEDYIYSLLNYLKSFEDLRNEKITDQDISEKFKKIDKLKNELSIDHVKEDI